MNNPQIVSKDKQQPLQAAKWQQLRLLVDTEEMEDLFESLNAFQIYRTGALLGVGEGLVKGSDFFDVYRAYIDDLKKGLVSVQSRYRPMFSTAWSQTADAFYTSEVGEGQWLVRPRLPIIQLQLHQFSFSSMDQKFRSMVHGPGVISWGIQFSYPQLFQDPDSRQIHKVDALFLNTALFKGLRKWMRHHTLPTPFEVGGRQITVPIRLGKNCFSWINAHSQLKACGLRVVT